jgi:hypothetical protein
MREKLRTLSASVGMRGEKSKLGAKSKPGAKSKSRENSKPGDP